MRLFAASVTIGTSFFSGIVPHSLFVRPTPAVTGQGEQREIRSGALRSWRARSPRLLLLDPAQAPRRKISATRPAI